MAYDRTFPVGSRWINPETGIVFEVERSFLSGGERIINYVVVAGPHSVGCRAQSRPNYGVGSGLRQIASR